MAYVILHHITPPPRGIGRSETYQEIEATIRLLETGDGFLVDSQKKRATALTVSKRIGIPIKTWKCAEGIMIWRPTDQPETPAGTEWSPAFQRPQPLPPTEVEDTEPESAKRGRGRPKGSTKNPEPEPVKAVDEDRPDIDEDDPTVYSPDTEDDEDDTKEEEEDALLDEEIRLDEQFERDEITKEVYLARQQELSAKQRAIKAAR